MFEVEFTVGFYQNFEIFARFDGAEIEKIFFFYCCCWQFFCRCKSDDFDFCFVI